MDRTNIYLLIFGIVFVTLWGQLIASGNIGNRSYSAWYETHFLVERKGAWKLIYFNPKHFGRYTLYEVAFFLVSFLFPVGYAVMSLFVVNGLLQGRVFNSIIGIATVLLFIVHFVVVVVNDVGACKDNKKRFYLETGERDVVDFENLPFPLDDKNGKLVNDIILEGLRQRNNPYFTIHNLRSSYYTRIEKARNNVEKIEKINKDYIEYFKNIEKLIVVKENKDGTLVFKK